MATKSEGPRNQTHGSGAFLLLVGYTGRLVQAPPMGSEGRGVPIDIYDINAETMVLFGLLDQLNDRAER